MEQRDVRRDDRTVRREASTVIPDQVIDFGHYEPQPTAGSLVLVDHRLPGHLHPFLRTAGEAVLETVQRVEKGAGGAG